MTSWCRAGVGNLRKGPLQVPSDGFHGSWTEVVFSEYAPNCLLKLFAGLQNSRKWGDVIL